MSKIHPGGIGASPGPLAEIPPFNSNPTSLPNSTASTGTRLGTEEKSKISPSAVDPPPLTDAPPSPEPTTLAREDDPDLVVRKSSRPRLKSLQATGNYHLSSPDTFYDFGTVLGAGAFATVYEVMCKADGVKWACKKIVKSKLKNVDLKGLQMEMDTMTTVNHDNIIKLKEVYETPTDFNLILELCHGGELFDRIVQMEAYNEQQAAEAFSHMLEAMGHCHRLNIVHRDLKPENLIYRAPMPDMILKLADFGLAQQVSPEELLHDKSGTPGYVAPEMLKGELYGKPVDMWALGVILYILLCGFPPFYEDDTSELFKIIKKGEYEFFEPYWDEVSDEAKDLVSKLLVVDPEKRYTAVQAKEHPWMKAFYDKNVESASTILPHFQGNLRKYQARRRFKGIVYGVMVASIMKTFTKKTKAKVAKAKAQREERERRMLASESVPALLENQDSNAREAFDPEILEIGVRNSPLASLPDVLPEEQAKTLAGRRFRQSLIDPDKSITKTGFFVMTCPTREEAEAERNADMEMAINLGIDWQGILSAVRWDRELREIKGWITTPVHVHCVDESTGNYPIHVASQNGHLDLVRWLHSAGAKLNVQNGTGQTPLHMCKGYDIYDVAAFLLENGANPEIKNWAGHPAKFGIEGDKDPSDPLFMFEYCEETHEALEALVLLKKKAKEKPGCLDKVSLAKLGLAVKRGLKGMDVEDWTEECQKSFVELLQSIG
jgi:calcium/calmodulin-dependent protein kinase I